MASVSVNRVTFGPFRGLMVSKYDTPEWRNVLAEPDKIMEQPGALILKDSPTTRAAIVTVRIDGVKHPLHIKRLNRRGMDFTVKYLFQRSRARRLFLNHVALIERGIPTLAPVAALSRRAGPFLLQSFFITEQLEAKTLFGLWEKNIYPSGNPPGRRREIMLAVARLVAKMHAAGVFHRDLKSSNILIKADGEPVIADLDGARIHNSVSYGQRARDLARLSTSLVPLANIADRHVFLKEYISSFEGGDDIRKMGVNIARKGLSILRSKRLKNKYADHEYKYFDEFTERQKRWLCRFSAGGIRANKSGKNVKG